MRHFALSSLGRSRKELTLDWECRCSTPLPRVRRDYRRQQPRPHRLSQRLRLAPLLAPSLNPSTASKSSPTSPPKSAPRALQSKTSTSSNRVRTSSTSPSPSADLSSNACDARRRRDFRSLRLSRSCWHRCMARSSRCTYRPNWSSMRSRLKAWRLNPQERDGLADCYCLTNPRFVHWRSAGRIKLTERTGFEITPS